jgi:sec-independent protein translocase protein TatC
VIVGAFVVAAVITPPDVVSQLLLAIPMCLLYEVGLIAARLLARRDQDRPADAA